MSSENNDLLKEIAALQKNVEELTLEKQRLISIVSHDLRSPLNRLFALIQLLQLGGKNLTAEQKDYVGKMHLVIADGLAMMRNLVDYRNLEHRTIDLRIEPVNIREFLITTVKHFASIAEKKGIQIVEEYENDLIIHTDKQCVHRIVDNILSNALKFSSTGKKVWIRAKVNSTKNINIEIKDEARGFLPSDASIIFRKFQKLTARPTGGESSTGLGLFIAHAMAEKIKGKVFCKNTEGIGSVFSVILPSIE